MGKRSNGEGSIRKRVDNSWEARFTVGHDPKTGKQIRKSLYGKTKEEVAQKLREAQYRIDTGTYVEPSKITVYDWMYEWLNTYKKGRIRLTTYSCYKDTIDLHIVPSIGHYLLAKIRPEHVQKMLNNLYDKKNSKSPKLAPATIIKIKNILNNAFKQAVKNGLIQNNIIDAVVTPKLEQREINFLTPENQKKFIKELEGDRLKPLFMLALGTGMRIGELLALKWVNVNLTDQTIEVVHSLSYGKNPETSKHEFRINPPKTKYSRRTIPLTRPLVIILRQHKKMQSEERQRNWSVYNNMDLVFCTELGGYLIPRNINRKAYNIVKNAELPHISFHSLRHTFASRAFENDLKPKVIQEILGHADISTTLNTYTHIMEDTKRDEMNKLEDVFCL